jgi:hypothetical protein
MDSLISKPTPGDLKIALNNLPRGKQGLDNTYEQAIERIQGQEADFKKLAIQVLSWFVYAKRPLCGPELQHAPGVKTNNTSELDNDFLPELEDLISICAGLVTVDKESNVIRLVHYTTREYFKRTQKVWFPKAESDITTICVTHLSFSVFESGSCQADNEFKKRLGSHQLYDYAAHNWGNHAREALTLCQEAIDFLESELKVEAASQALLAIERYPGYSEYSQEFPRQMRGLHLAAYFGLKDAIIDLLEMYDLKFEDSYNRTPLLWAAESRHEVVVKLLLKKGS